MQLPRLFADAARRAREAGFDGVELHYAHAYTMASFLSRLNTRDDGYGGDVASRVEAAARSVRAVRAEPWARLRGGLPLPRRRMHRGRQRRGRTPRSSAREFARAGMDFLSLSRGGKFDDAKQPKVGEAAYPYTGRSGYECMPSYYSDAQRPVRTQPRATARASARRFATMGLTTPVIAAGGIHSFAQAEAVLAEGKADIVGFARQALADPDWFRKVVSGRGQDVRLCLYTNYCEALDQRHRQVTCELWDREALDEPAIRLSRDGKRRLTPPRWQP